MSRSLKVEKPAILIAEDDPDDRLLLKEAFSAFEGECSIQFVEDGEDLMDYLCHRNKYAEQAPPRPTLIMLDLTMPRKNGWEGLAEIRESQDLRDIPLVIWTTSKDEPDRVFCEEGGASGYVTKPDGFLEMCTALEGILKTWVPSCRALRRH